MNDLEKEWQKHDRLEQERIAKYKVISKYTAEEWKEHKKLKIIENEPKKLNGKTLTLYSH